MKPFRSMFKGLYMCITIFEFLTYKINVNGDLCVSNGTKVPIHIRSIMTFASESESFEHALFLQAAADHVNSIDGILDGYRICFRWDHAKVCDTGVTLHSRHLQLPFKHI